MMALSPPHRMRTVPDLDRFDVRILAALQECADLTHGELAERVLLSPSQCSRRIQRLREAGYIERTVAILNAERLGLGVTAYVQVSLRAHAEASGRAFRDRVRRAPEVQECCAVTGDADYLIKVRTPTLKRFADFLNDTFMRDTDVVATVRSSIVLEEVKRSTALPLDAVPDGA